MTLQRWRQFKASKSECGSHSVPTMVWWSQQVSELEVCFRPHKSQDFFTPFGLKWLVLIQSVLHFNLFFRLVLLFFFSNCSMRQSQSFHVRKCELRSAQVCGFRFSKESHSSGPVPECQCHLLTSAQGSAGLGISPRQAVTLYVRKKSRHLRSVNAAAAEIKCQDLFSGVYIRPFRELCWKVVVYGNDPEWSETGF